MAPLKLVLEHSICELSHCIISPFAPPLFLGATNLFRYHLKEGTRPHTRSIGHIRRTSFLILTRLEGHPNLDDKTLRLIQPPPSAQLDRHNEIRVL
jgi:hypothetical protein